MKLILNVQCLKLIHVLACTPVIDSRSSRKMVASINHKISTKTKDCRKVLLSEFKFCAFVRISMQSELALILVLSKFLRILIFSEYLCCQKFDDIIMFMLSEFVKI